MPSISTKLISLNDFDFTQSTVRTPKQASFNNLALQLSMIPQKHAKMKGKVIVTSRRKKRYSSTIDSVKGQNVKWFPLNPEGNQESQSQPQSPFQSSPRMRMANPADAEKARRLKVILNQLEN